LSDSQLDTAGDALSTLGTIATIAAPIAPEGPWQSALRIAGAALTAGSRLLYQGAGHDEALTLFRRLGDDYARLRAEALRRAEEMEPK
jgi:hypothetical protein